MISLHLSFGYSVKVHNNCINHHFHFYNWWFSLYKEKEGNSDNHQRKNKQTDHLNISNPSYLPQRYVIRYVICNVDLESSD